MPKPTKQQRRIHAEFLKRQKVYESKYTRIFFAILSKQYLEAAKVYPLPYMVNPNDYKKAIENVYMTCIPNEAGIAWNYYVEPLTADRKDFFDDLAALLGFDIPKGEHIRLWRNISSQWLEVNILSKIRGIASTTQRAIAKIIESAIEEGLGAEQIAKAIREQSKGDVNQYRSVLIARTETIMAMNKGRRLSMFTSNLVWDKKWLDTLDERTRTSHRKVAYKDYIPLDEPYVLEIIKNKKVIGTEKADYPGDPNLSAGNVCNCRCTETFEVQRDAQGKPRKKTGIPMKLTELLTTI